MRKIEFESQKIATLPVAEIKKIICENLGYPCSPYEKNGVFIFESTSQTMHYFAERPTVLLDIKENVITLRGTNFTRLKNIKKNLLDF